MKKVYRVKCVNGHFFNYTPKPNQTCPKCGATKGYYKNRPIVIKWDTK